jgi:excisionase family DNA binding protein
MARSDSPSSLLTIAETAAILAVDRAVVSQWINAGMIPSIRLGPGDRMVRIAQHDLEDLIDNHELPPTRGN